MKRHIPRHQRRALSDRSWIAYFQMLREQRDAQRERQRARAVRWPPARQELTAAVDASGAGVSVPPSAAAVSKYVEDFSIGGAIR